MVSAFGPIINQSLAQAAAAERVQPKPLDRREGRAGAVRRRGDDQYESVATAVDAGEAVRTVKGNDQEEAHEDRQDHESRELARGQVDAARREKHIDLSA